MYPVTLEERGAFNNPGPGGLRLTILLRPVNPYRGYFPGNSFLF